MALQPHISLGAYLRQRRKKLRFTQAEVRLANLKNKKAPPRSMGLQRGFGRAIGRRGLKSKPAMIRTTK
jgi:hypothetical protein